MIFLPTVLTAIELLGNFKDLMQRELKTLPGDIRFKEKSNFLEGSVKAKKVSEITLGENKYSWNFSIGSVMNIECILSTGSLIVGSWIKATYKEIKEGVKSLTFEAPSVKIVKDRPYFVVNSTYTVESDGKLLKGYIKLIGVDLDDNALVCTHDEPGYKKTFAKIITDMIQSLKFSTNTDHRLIRKSIYISRLNKNPIGYTKFVTFIPRKGAVDLEYTTDHFSSFLFLRNGHSLSGSHSSSLTRSDDLYQIYQINEVEYKNLQETKKLELKRMNQYKYKVKGKLQGKDFSHEFEAKQPLIDELAQRKKIIMWLNEGAQKPLELFQYSSKADLKGVTRSITKMVNREENIIEAKVSQLIVRSKVHDNKIIKNWLTMGNFEIESELAYYFLDSDYKNINTAHTQRTNRSFNRVTFSQNKTPNGFFLQIGAFKNLVNAESFAKKMQQKYNKPIYLAEGKKLYLIWLGGFSNYKSAIRFLFKLRSNNVNAFYRGKL